MTDIPLTPLAEAAARAAASQLASWLDNRGGWINQATTEEVADKVISSFIGEATKTSKAKSAAAEGVTKSQEHARERAMEFAIRLVGSGGSTIILLESATQIEKWFERGDT